jgi:hypothetical protein
MHAELAVQQFIFALIGEKVSDPQLQRSLVSRVAAIVAGAIAAASCAEAAAAVSLTNRDDRDHKVKIIEDDKRQDHTLRPSAALDGVCQKGCIVRLNDSENDEYELEGTEVVSIEGGYLYYDDPETPIEASPSEPGTAQGPKQ